MCCASSRALMGYAMDTWEPTQDKNGRKGWKFQEATAENLHSRGKSWGCGASSTHATCEDSAARVLLPGVAWPVTTAFQDAFCLSNTIFIKHFLMFLEHCHLNRTSREKKLVCLICYCARAENDDWHVVDYNQPYYYQPHAPCPPRPCRIRRISSPPALTSPCSLLLQGPCQELILQIPQKSENRSTIVTLPCHS